MKLTIKSTKPFHLLNNEEKMLFAARLIQNGCSNIGKGGCSKCPLLDGLCIVSHHFSTPEQWNM